MKVLHFLDTLDGAARALRPLAVLRQLRVEVAVVLPPTAVTLAPRYAEAGAEVLVGDLGFTAGTPWRFAAALVRCRRLVARARPDLIHSHSLATTLVARLALGRRHPLPRLFQVSTSPHLESTAWRLLDLRSAGARDRWIAGSRWLCGMYARDGVSPERLFFAYQGLDVARLRAGPPGGLRRSLAVGPAVPLVGMVAPGDPRRRVFGAHGDVAGHEDFLAALACVARERPAVRGVIVGDALPRRVRELGRALLGDAVSFTAYRSDLATVYADLDVAVHPSHVQSLDGAATSLAAACPTVAAAAGGLAEIVVDGRTGWLVPPADPGRMATAILEALGDRDEARRRVRAGQARVAELFALERSARELAAIYHEVLETRAAGVPLRESPASIGASAGAPASSDGRGSDGIVARTA